MAGLNLKQEKFVAAYIGRANGNATEAARLAGYSEPNKQGPRLLVNVGIQDAIEKLRVAIRAEGIANQQNRIDEQNSRWELLKKLREERASDSFHADVPGGTTGLVIKQLKHVQHRYEKDPDNPNDKPKRITEEVWETALDAAYLREIRELEKATATELGQIVTKSEEKLTIDGPIQYVDVVRPAPDGDQ